MVDKTSLGWVSYSGADPVFVISENDFERLESIYGEGKIPEAARKRLKEIAGRYLFQRRTEQLQQTWKDVAKHLSVLKSTADALQRFSSGYDDRSDARLQFETVLEEQLERVTLSAWGTTISVLRPDGRLEDVAELLQLPPLALRVGLSPALLHNLASEMELVLERVSKEIVNRAKRDGSAKAPSALKVFLLAVSSWAESAGLQFGPYVNNEVPARFAHFLTALLLLAPAEFRENKAPTVGGVAAKIRSYKEAQTKRKRERFRGEA